MSASLVGSEMCIRDRPTGGPAPDRPCNLRCSLRCIFQQLALELAKQGSPCLLYTSDAADDM
eukprot:740105-Alexandrium_andersonii.AAC.1